MKIFAPIPLRVTPAGVVRRPRAVEWKIASKRGVLRRFQHFIVSSGRVERCICNKWIDRACIGTIVASVLYFVPILVPLLME